MKLANIEGKKVDMIDIQRGKIEDLSNDYLKVFYGAGDPKRLFNKMTEFNKLENGKYDLLYNNSRKWHINTYER